MTPEANSGTAATRPKRRSWLRIATLAIAAIAVAWAAWRTMLPFRRSIVRDAFVDAQLVNLAPQVQGEIVEMLVQEQERVEAGQVLARIDPAVFRRERDLRAARLETAIQAHRQSEADLAVLAGEVPRRIEIAALAREAAGDDVERAQHEVEGARAKLEMAREDEARYTSLARSGSSTVRRMQEAVRDRGTASAQVGGTNRALAASRKARVEAERRLELSRLGELEIEASRRKVAERAGQVEEAKRALQLAEIELAYTEVVAPFSGIVARRWHHRGDYAHVGEPLFSLYDPSLVYVTANVPEDLLRGVAPGNPATLDVIAWDEPFRGRVLWVGSATDAKFSLIPRDVSAGEFTWVVQRVPVRIWFEPDARFGELRPGLSVTAGIEHGPGDETWAKATLAEEARLEQLRTKAALEASEVRRTRPVDPANAPAAGLPPVDAEPAGSGATP